MSANPQAFPQSQQDLTRHGEGRGMSLLDWFAGQALNEIVRQASEISLSQCAKELGIDIKEFSSDKHFHQYCALMAYKLADAMLKARQSTPK